MTININTIKNFLGEKNPMFGKKGNLHPRWNKQGDSLGKKWYHNPYTNEVKYFIPGKEPENFYLGRKLKKGN